MALCLRCNKQQQYSSTSNRVFIIQLLNEKEYKTWEKFLGPISESSPMKIRPAHDTIPRVPTFFRSDTLNDSSRVNHASSGLTKPRVSAETPLEGKTPRACPLALSNTVRSRLSPSTEASGWNWHLAHESEMICTTPQHTQRGRRHGVEAVLYIRDSSFMYQSFVFLFFFCSLLQAGAGGYCKDYRAIIPRETAANAAGFPPFQEISK